MAAIVSKYRILIVIFGVALILRLAFMLVMIDHHGSGGIAEMFPDTAKYIEAAEYISGDNSEGEYDLFLVGPGYPSLLTVYKFILDDNYWPLLLLQVILSSLTCVFIYLSTIILTKNKTIAVVAGLLAALSMTSISLANSVLTETVFLLLFVLGLFFFLSGLSTNRLGHFIIGGIVGAAAVLIRSVVMFYPAVIIIIAALFPVSKMVADRKKLLLKSIITALIIVLVPLLWGMRNVIKYDTIAVSGTGMGAAKIFLAAKVNYEAEGRSPHQFRAYRDSVYNAMVPDIKLLRIKKINDEAQATVLSTFRNYPGRFIKLYLKTALNNVISVSTLQYVQVPPLTGIFEFFDSRLNRGFSNPAALILSLLGFVVYLRRNYRIALILFINVLYFAALSGVTFGQGSRVFFPSQSTDVILSAIGLVFLYDLGRYIIRSLRREKQGVVEVSRQD